MSAAYALSLHPDRFSVTIFEQSSFVGGMATSIPLDKATYGADYINDGVQGASPVFYNTYALFDKLGFKASPVGMQVSFGRDADTDFWSNVFPGRIVDRCVPSSSLILQDANSSQVSLRHTKVRTCLKSDQGSGTLVRCHSRRCNAENLWVLQGMCSLVSCSLKV